MVSNEFGGGGESGQDCSLAVLLEVVLKPNPNIGVVGVLKSSRD